MNIKKLLCLMICVIMSFGSLVACGGNSSGGGDEAPETPEEFYAAAAKALENASYVETWTEKKTSVDKNGNPATNSPLPNSIETMTFEVNGDKIKASTLVDEFSIDTYFANGMIYDASQQKKAPCTDADLATVAANLGFNAQNTGINSYENVAVEKNADGGYTIKGTVTKAETAALLTATMQGIIAGIQQSSGYAMSFSFDPEASFCEIVFDKNNRVISSHNSTVCTISAASDSEAYTITYKTENIFTYEYKDVTVTLPDDIDTYEAYNSYMEMLLS